MGTGTYCSQKFWPDSVLRQIDDELFAKKAWEHVPDLREEFRTFSQFWAYCRGLQHGARRLTGGTVRHEERFLGELMGIRRGNDVLLRKPKI